MESVRVTEGIAFGLIGLAFLLVGVGGPIYLIISFRKRD
jgi:hypothetical protein